MRQNSKGTDDKIEGAKALLANIAKTNDDKVNDLRNAVVDLRTTVTAISARGQGANDIWQYLVAGGGLLIGFLSVGFVITHNKVDQPSYPPQYPPPQYPLPNVQVVPVVPVNTAQTR